MVVHVITDLQVGGAELALYRLARELQSRGVAQRVVSLRSGGPVGSRLVAAGIPVEYLGMAGLASLPMAVLGLRRRLRAWSPDVVQTWMYHADLVGGLAARLARCREVYWGIRQSDLQPPAVKRSTRAVARACALLSRALPTAAICASSASVDAHRRFGYRCPMIVVPNGIDVPDAVPPTQAARAGLGFAATGPVLGRVARFDPQKDFPTLLAAVRLLADEWPCLGLALCGPGCDESNAALAELIEAAGVRPHVVFLGTRSDVDRVYAACDVVVSSSSAEGFPNVVAEAMAAGVPVIATDAGDSALIIDDADRIVPVRSAEALAAAVAKLLRAEVADRRSLGERDRARVQEHYSITTMADRYMDLYRGRGSHVRD